MLTSQLGSGEFMQRVHNLAQLHNSYLSQKVGSGFDIATCVFGSQIFERSASLKSNIESLLATQDMSSQLSAFLSNKFTGDVQPFSLAADLGLCLIDVASGSDTRVLVKKVLQWDADLNSFEFSKLKEYFAEVAELLQGKVK